MTSAPSSATEELAGLFADPPSTFGPTPLWWWSAEKVTRERLEWQLRRFHEGGIYNLVVINLAPAGPLFGAPSDDPQWFSDEWWDRFRDACTIAGSLGMHLWFYDQIGFSGANIQGRITRMHPEAVGQTLRSVTATVQEGQVAGTPGGTLLAAYTRSGQRVELTAEGMTDAGDGESLLVVTTHATAFDYLDSAAVDRLLDLVHREYERRVPEYLGSVIAGSFQDELPSTNAWTSQFPEQFRARRGYDLMDYLPALFRRGGLTEAKVRSDYYAVRSQLTEEALFRPLARWHHNHSLLLGADQSNPARAGLPLQSTQIYTDYPRTHRWISAVGSDHEGDSKFHASLARLHGHDRVWLEAFHSSGWGGTLEDTWDWLLPFLRSGATLYNPHASYYSTVGGWFEWAPPSTDWRQPYWGGYRHFARAVARVMSMMTWGTYDADVAVLHPTATMQAALPINLPVDHFLSSSPGPDFADVQATQDVYSGLCGVTDWFRSRPGLLDRAGISFDVIDDDSVQRSVAVGGRLRVAAQAYATVVLPSVEFLEEGTATALLAFCESGGRVVVVGRAPRHATGLAGNDASVAALVAHPNCILVRDPAAAVPVLGFDEQHVRSDTPLLVRRAGDTGIALVGGAFPNASAYPLRDQALARWDGYDFDRGRYAGERTIRIRAQVVSAEVWDPARGTRAPATVRHDGAESVVVMRTDGAPLTLLTWREGAGTEAPTRPAEAAPTQTLTLDEGWVGELVPTLDNMWGDLARPTGRRLDRPQIWTLETREPGTTWVTTKVTQGQRLLVHPPAAPDDLPPPLTAGECAAVSAGAALGDGSWQRHEWSASRGLVRDLVGALGTKGSVPPEFVTGPNPKPGQQLVLRGLVVTDHRGPADLVISSSAKVQVWWNGTELVTDDNVYSDTLPVLVDREINVLEYRQGASQTIDPMGDVGLVRSSFTLSRTGEHTKRPEHMVVGDPTTRPDGQLVFSCPIEPLEDLTSAHLVVGAARAVTVLINDRVIARQEKVEYYESEWGANPSYFSHEVSGFLTGVDDVIEVRLETSDPRDVVYVDLVLVGAERTVTVCSGTGWTCRSSGVTSTSRSTPVQWGSLDSAAARRRPHPLPGAEWLRGAPELGATPLPIAVTDSAVPSPQEFRVLLPAGTREVSLPLRVPARVSLDGRPLTPEGDVLRFDAPLRAPSVLTLVTEPTVSDRAGAAWSAPIELVHEPAPIALGDWTVLGLPAWSGGVRYRRSVDLSVGERWTLDLGDLRGNVEVRVNGGEPATAFCAPFRFDLDCGPGLVELEVTVFNTLGPFLHESTPTSWVFNTQLASGLFGPVALHQHGA